MSTKMICVGAGSAFCIGVPKVNKSWQSNLIIEENGKKLLIDAGGDIRHSLAEMGLSYKDIDAVYITHAHADHIGGMEYLAFCSYFDPTMKEKIQLICNNELLREIWNSSLRGGLKSIQGKQTNLVDFFDIASVRNNGTFVWEDIEFNIVQSVHVMDGYAIVSSFGLMFKTTPENSRVFITGDTQFNPNQILDFYKQANLIIQDCETSPFRSGVHANYEELKTLPIDIKSKMHLIHYQDNILEKDSGEIKKEWKEKAMNDGFLGFLEKGKTIFG